MPPPEPPTSNHPTPLVYHPSTTIQRVGRLISMCAHSSDLFRLAWPGYPLRIGSKTITNRTIALLEWLHSLPIGARKKGQNRTISHYNFCNVRTPPSMATSGSSGLWSKIKMKTASVPVHTNCNNIVRQYVQGSLILPLFTFRLCGESYDQWGQSKVCTG